MNSMAELTHQAASYRGRKFPRRGGASGPLPVTSYGGAEESLASYKLLASCLSVTFQPMSYCHRE